jgi:hypothetical protein
MRSGVLMSVGPFTRADLGDGKHIDLFLLRYDDDGRLLSTRTEQAVKDALVGRSDVFVFSHGWNNNFKAALNRYEGFIKKYAAQRTRLGLPTPTDYAPLLIGIIWPSTSFLFPWEQGPKIAAVPDQEDVETEEMLRLVSGSLGIEARSELVGLLDGSEQLTNQEAGRAAELVLQGTSRGRHDSDDGSSGLSAADFLSAWAELDEAGSPPPDPNEFGGVAGGVVGGQAAGAPQAAAGGPSLDPRNLLRAGTLWLMKDRAGKVGAHGVSPLVQHILSDTQAPLRLHLVGHSFGARVVLSALVAADAPRPAHSMLLLQPAVNRWCFADKVIDLAVPGGYNPALDRVTMPIFSTFSRYDAPLTQSFHLAVRDKSLGEIRIAAIGDTVRYGALGGYGPAGIDDRTVKVPAQPEGSAYSWTEGTRVVAVDGGVDVGGEHAIGGHGDISNAVTCWALHSLTGTG